MSTGSPAGRAALALLAIMGTACGGAGTSPPATPGTAATDAGLDDEDEVTTEDPSADTPPEPAVTPPRPPPPPDYHGNAVRNAAQIFRNMQGDLRACYKKRVSSAPGGQASILVDVLIGPDGKVRTVDTVGGDSLGDVATRCITDRVRTAKFDAPHGGGTLRIKVPFSFRTAVKKTN